ncbi:LysR family transcriptional regulator [Blastococcus sp. SYSU D00669]
MPRGRARARSPVLPRGRRRAAAQRSFVSQPALSRQIRALEQHLRTPLFGRRPAGVVLTPAGRALVPHARSVVAAWDSQLCGGDALLLREVTEGPMRTITP